MFSPCLLVACSQPLGIESRLIPDTALTASTYLEGLGPESGRLYVERSMSYAQTGTAWVARVSDTEQFIEVQLPRTSTVVGVQTQGRAGLLYQEWVKSYMVQYARDGQLLTYVTDSQQIRHVSSKILHFLNPYSSKS